MATALKTAPSERKVVNLDELIPATQYVILDGDEHPVEPASVEMFLTVMKKRRNLKEADDQLEQIQQAIELITLACPSIKRERLLKLSLRALTAITDIIEEQMADSAEGPDGENAPEPNTDSGE